MDPANAGAVSDLREAVGAYNAYCYFVDRGMVPVNADDDPADLIEAARLNLAERIRVCQSLGLSDQEIEQIVLDLFAERSRDV
jgi:Asp-tRNA(Asn)/Glu-tRNA(Gln) amidotransferase B subunit